jgi:hypothetical protein
MLYTDCSLIFFCNRQNYFYYFIFLIVSCVIFFSSISSFNTSFPNLFSKLNDNYSFLLLIYFMSFLFIFIILLIPEIIYIIRIYCIFAFLFFTLSWLYFKPEEILKPLIKHILAYISYFINKSLNAFLFI